MITRENYEVYFVDYFDGKLSTEEIEELMRFLSTSKDLEDEFYSLLEMYPELDLQPSDFIFETVKRDERMGYELSTFDYLCIADVENEISSNEQEILTKSVAANTKLKHDLNLYKQTKLPDEVIVFPNKEALKKNVFKQHKLRTAISYSSIAAAVLLVMYFSFYDTPTKQISENTPKAKSVTVESPLNSSKVEPQVNKVTDDTKVSTSPQERAAGKLTAGSNVTKKVENVEPIDKKESQTTPAEERENIAPIKSQIAVAVETSKPIPAKQEGYQQQLAKMEERSLTSALADNEIATTVSSFLSTTKKQTTELSNTYKDYKGRKKGILFARMINGVNTIFGTDIKYSSKYNSDGKLVAMDLQAGPLSYAKKKDAQE